MFVQVVSRAIAGIGYAKLLDDPGRVVTSGLAEQSLELRMVEPALNDDRSKIAMPTTSFEVQAPPDVTIIVVSYNTEHLLCRMFEALEASRGALRLQIVCVDNASRDGSVQLLLTRYPHVELIQNKTNV